MTDQLKPCPFCGPQRNEDVQPALFSHDVKGVGPIEYSVRCSCCGIHKFMEHEDETITAWNARPETRAEVLRVLDEVEHMVRQSCLVPPDGGSPTEGECETSERAGDYVATIRAKYEEKNDG